MAEQNRYKISYAYQVSGWSSIGVWTGETWQDAINNWIDDWRKVWDVSYQVISEKPEEDGKSGLMDIIQDLPQESNARFLLVRNVRATIIEEC